MPGRRNVAGFRNTDVGRFDYRQTSTRSPVLDVLPHRKLEAQPRIQDFDRAIRETAIVA